MRARRRIRRAVIVLVVLVVAAVLYQVWSLSGRQGYAGPPNLLIAQKMEFGSDQGRGNVLAMQPWMQAEDYSCQQAFENKLDGYFQAAERNGWLNDKTIVVLPEYLGAWLVCAGQKQRVWKAATVGEAMKIKAIANLPSTVCQAIAAPCSDWQKYAVFSSSATSMASIYDDTLSLLARKYGVTVVGGSIVLPSPSVVDGRLRAGRGALYNVTPVYRADGRVCAPLVKKVYLTEVEKPWQSAGKVDDLPVYDTPAGRLGVLICADSWFPKAYETLRRKGVQVVVVPSYMIGDNKLARHWKGYSGQKTPADVDEEDVESISLKEAWVRYALPGRFKAAGARYGAMSCLRGDLWGMGSDSFITAIYRGQPKVLGSKDGAALVNTWIGK